MIRVAVTAAAMAVASLAVPANAAVFEIAYSGYVTGIQNVYNPNQIGCNGGSFTSPLCQGVGFFGEAVAGTVFLNGATPTGTFSFGNSRGSGLIEGTIIGTVQTGVSGINLSLFRDQAGGPFFQSGNAPTFSARLISIDGVAAPAPVPEPATWGMMLLGFGAMGYAMRRRTATSARIRFA